MVTLYVFVSPALLPFGFVLNPTGYNLVKSWFGQHANKSFSCRTKTLLDNLFQYSTNHKQFLTFFGNQNGQFRNSFESPTTLSSLQLEAIQNNFKHILVQLKVN